MAKKKAARKAAKKESKEALDPTAQVCARVRCAVPVPWGSPAGYNQIIDFDRGLRPAC